MRGVSTSPLRPSSEHRQGSGGGGGEPLVGEGGEEGLGPLAAGGGGLHLLPLQGFLLGDGDLLAGGFALLLLLLLELVLPLSLGLQPYWATTGLTADCISSPCTQHT